MICYELRSRLLGCWQYYLYYFPVFPLLCYLFVLGMGFTDCKTNSTLWIVFVLVFFHVFVFLSSFVYFSWMSTSDILMVFVQSLVSLFVFFSVTFIIKQPYLCVIDSFSYAVSGMVFFVFNFCTVLFSYWLHRHDDYPYYAPMYYTYGIQVGQPDIEEVSQYDYSSLIDDSVSQTSHFGILGVSRAQDYTSF